MRVQNRLKSYVFQSYLNLSRKSSKIAKLGSFIGRPNSYSLLNLDTIIMTMFKKKKNGFYVELGANDGLRQSNTLKLERELNWRGVLVEPSPSAFRILVKYRKKNNELFNCACVSFEYPLEKVGLFEGDLMSSLDIYNEDINNPSEWAKLGRSFALKESLEPYSLVKAMTLSSILEKCQAPKIIDLLSLDVEGAELEVLKGIDHKKYRFQMILIETRDLKRTSDYLNEVGYKFKGVASRNDAIFCDNL